jgi:S-adenosylmethionine decarboxylase
VTNWPSHNHINELNGEAVDHFICKNGVIYAGDHIIIDLWGASRLDDIALMEATLLTAVQEIKATLLHIHLHHFQPNGGISGVAVLAESHISVHTWPEKGYAAFDVFSCGDSIPERAVDVLKAAFHPEKTVVTALQRGSASE